MRSATTEIEGVGGGDYQRIYVPTDLSRDSCYPFDAGDPVRIETVSTECDRTIVVMTSDALELDVDSSELALRRSSREVQAALEEVADGGETP